jgi:hypothetical protein
VWLVVAVFRLFKFSTARLTCARFLSFALALTALAFAALFLAAAVFALAEALPTGFAAALPVFTLEPGADWRTGGLWVAPLANDGFFAAGLPAA